MKYYSLEEISKHCSKGDIWVVHNNRVYDVSKFSKLHPGGHDILLEHGGKDVGDTMEDISVHKHTKTAFNILRKYCIGYVEGYQNGITSSDSPDYNDQEAFLQGTDHDKHINWKKPILQQVANLGEHYMTWIHEPVEQNIRLFDSDFMEFFSVCPWYVVPLVWLPIAAALLWRAVVNTMQADDIHFLTFFGLFPGLQFRVIHILPLLIFGTFIWTFVEYMIHRFLFHATPPSSWPSLVRLHFVMHGQHHKDPLNRLRLVFPPVPASSLGIPLIASIYYGFPVGVSHTLCAGAVLGYIAYDLTHYYVHHGEPSLAYFKELKTYHIRHHFEDTNKGFGVSSKFWDIPFGTTLPPLVDAENNRKKA